MKKYELLKNTQHNYDYIYSASIIHTFLYDIQLLCNTFQITIKLILNLWSADWARK